MQYCGTISLDAVATDAIDAAFRKQAGLLSPEQIREQRLALGLTQQTLADLLGIGVHTLSRWENGGQIQQRAFDRLLRAFFTVPQDCGKSRTMPGCKSRKWRDYPAVSSRARLRRLFTRFLYQYSSARCCAIASNQPAVWCRSCKPGLSPRFPLPRCRASHDGKSTVFLGRHLDPLHFVHVAQTVLVAEEPLP